MVEAASVKSIVPMFTVPPAVGVEVAVRASTLPEVKPVEERDKPVPVVMLFPVAAISEAFPVPVILITGVALLALKKSE